MTTWEQIEERFEQEQFEYVRGVALERYKGGDKSYRFSTGICGLTTAGYGKLDEFGYFEYPLPVDQETLKVEVDL